MSEISCSLIRVIEPSPDAADMPDGYLVRFRNAAGQPRGFINVQHSFGANSI
jgi:hypothetical protein